MTDLIHDVLARAVDAGAPPDGYWRDYSQRLRAKLEERPRVSAMMWLPAAAAVAAIVTGFLLLREPQSKSLTTWPPPVVEMQQVSKPSGVVSSSPPPAASPVAVNSKTTRPGKAEVPQESLPVRSISVTLTEYARPQIAAPVEHRQTAQSNPPALQLTDFRLLRNGVEIARGNRLATEPGGLIWFADRNGKRYAISPSPQPGFQQAGVARENLITFESGADQFHWISSTAIVTGEIAIWVATDRVAAVPPTMPPLPGRWRLPPIFAPDVVRGPRLQKQLPDRKRESAADDTDGVRFGTARSIEDLSHQR